VIEALTGADRPLSTAALKSIVDVRRTRLELLLKVLDVDGAVQRVSGGWTATGRGWTYDAERYARVAAAREREQRLMLDYQETEACRMQFLQRALDDPTVEATGPCGRCDVCAGRWFVEDAPQAAVAAARARLARPGVELEPRAMWPTGMDRLGLPLKGRIAADVAMSRGRALARLSDLGRGQRLRALLDAPDDEAPDWLASSVVEVLRDWDWERRPAAVAAVPSRRHPRLIGSVAEGLARVGRLVPLGTLEPVGDGPTGEPGGNSAFRLAGVWGRLVAGPDMARALGEVDGPVLLVDDLASSRWTLTTAAVALREAGAQEVLPFALALDG
jgi:ATP-dependent DNA helicase RecQ